MEKKFITIEDLMIDNPAIMNNRALGIVVVGGDYSSFNNGFDNKPKYIGGQYVASDNAKKYASREYWENKGLLVLVRKSFAKNKKDEYAPRTLLERYEYLFGPLKKSQEDTEDDENKDIKGKKDKNKKKQVDKDEVVCNLFNCIDVMNFGVTFPVDAAPTSATGIIQYEWGVNLWEDSDYAEVQVLSPYKCSNKQSKDKIQSTLGSRCFLDRSFHSFGFTVNPWNIKNEEAVMKKFKGYPRVAYNEFKESALRDVTLLTSVSKAGCYNHFSMFVELKEGSLSVLPNLNRLLDIREDLDEKYNTIIDVTKVYQGLNQIADDIESIEIYYNQLTSTLECDTDTKLMDMTRKFSIINPTIEL